jgi:hypothetical protein
LSHSVFHVSVYPFGETISRCYNAKDTNLSPRTGKDYDGLSFSSNPPKAGVKAVTTTIDQVNGTGHLKVNWTGGDHWVVVPTDTTVINWMYKGMASFWSRVLSGIVTEIIGGK